MIDQHPGCHAELARPQGTQEAAGQRVSRLLHNDRLHPKDCAEWLCRQALRHVPRTGRGRFPMDWTSEDPQPLLVVSLVVGRRAVPIFWRAYDHTVLQGRMKRDALAVVKRAFTLLVQYVARPRVRLTADRGCADAAWCALL